MDGRNYVAEARWIKSDRQRRIEKYWGKNSDGEQETRGKEAPSPGRRRGYHGWASGNIEG